MLLSSLSGPMVCCKINGVSLPQQPRWEETRLRLLDNRSPSILARRPLAYGLKGESALTDLVFLKKNKMGGRGPGLELGIRQKNPVPSSIETPRPSPQVFLNVVRGRVWPTSAAAYSSLCRDGTRTIQSIAMLHD